jgi:Holliday junction resolvase RusA-like endonuclease
MIKLEVPGKPKHQERHRTFRRGRYNIIYDPSSKDKKAFARVASTMAPDELFTGPLSVHVSCFFERPKSHYRANGELKKATPFHRTSKPDVDNLLKFVFDALNGVFWKDDAIIVQGTCIKLYSAVPRTLVIIKEIEDGDIRNT